MATRDDNRFKIKPGAPKDGFGAGNGQRAQRFVSQVLKQASKSGAKASGAGGARPATTFGRGRVAAGRAGQTLAVTARRVVIKSRYVVLKKAGAKSVSTHLRYIARDGVTRDGERGQAYGPETDTADLKVFEERGKGDRHQFRFIVSVEDSGELEDLHGYTREFMRRMSTDLETRLDWVAVDHWDTDNPHTHIVLRGRAGEGKGKGQDLVIAPDYMAHGMRMRASELATEWLGPRTELEIRQGLLREVEQERLTSLDRALLRQASDGVVELTVNTKAAAGRERALLIGRLQRLTAMGLADPNGINRWRLRPDFEMTLRAMGERGDIVRTMQRALGRQQRELAIFAPSDAAQSVIGCVVGKGLVNELQERGYLVLDGIDGRAHYVALPAGTELEQFPEGAVVEARGAVQARGVDKTVAAMADGGLYRTEHHLAVARAQVPALRDPQDIVAAHVRRLEALRRAGIVERVDAGVWRVPADLPERAGQYDAHSLAGGNVALLSHLPIERQTRAIGATWLDRQLIGCASAVADNGFGAELRGALRERSDFLVEQGLAQQRGTRVFLVRDLLATLRRREIDAAGDTLSSDTGLPYRPTPDGARVSGVYRRAVPLTSGRFVMLDDGSGFALVPWKPMLERHLGQHITATLHGSGATWEVGRRRSVGS